MEQKKSITEQPACCGCANGEVSDSRRKLMRGLGWGAFFTTLAALSSLKPSAAPLTYSPVARLKDKLVNPYL